MTVDQSPNAKTPNFQLLLFIALFIALPYVAAVLHAPFLFLISVVVSGIGLLLSFSFLVAQVILRFLPAPLQQMHQQHTLRFRGIIVLTLSALMGGFWYIHHDLFYGHPANIRWVITGAFWFYVLFAGLILVFLKSKKFLLPFAVVLLLFVTGVAFLYPKPSAASYETTQEQLRSFPYLTWVSSAKNPEKSGVTVYNKERSLQGWNLYNSRAQSKAYLIDMEGRVLHNWAASVRPDVTWQHVELGREGELFAIVKDVALLKLNPDSSIAWKREARHHHDLAVADNNDVFAINRKDDVGFVSGIPVPILNDYITVLSSDGSVREEISVFPFVSNQVSFRQVRALYRWLFTPSVFWFTLKNRFKKTDPFLFLEDTPLDVLHTNAIEILEKDIPGAGRKQDWLISIREFDLVGIIDHQSRKLIWQWSPGKGSRQHNPTALQNGNLLIFDNGLRAGKSRVLELDPLHKSVVWQYGDRPQNNFFSPRGGCSQRLENGNTLITETDSGRVFEITNDGTIVWEFFNPEMKRETQERSSIYRMVRLTQKPRGVAP